MDIEGLIGQVAFPIVMCCWFMFRTETIISKNTESTDRLTQLLETEILKKNS